jgi:AcrR family transcriptional regulator
VLRERKGRSPRLDGAERRRQIVEACVWAIADRGFSSTSVRVIARQAGVSLGTLQHHFDGKDEIVLACLSHVYDEYLRGATRILTRSEPALQRLERLVEWILGDPKVDYLWRVFLALAPETIYDPRLARTDAEASARWNDLLRATVQEAIDNGQLAGDATTVAIELTTVMNGALLELHRNPPRLSRRSAITLSIKGLHANRADA